MADAKTTALTSLATPVDEDLVYIVDDPGGSPVGKKTTRALLIGRSIGTSFPGSPSTGDVCYRTDRHIEYFYDGTQWLGTRIHNLGFGSQVSITSNATSYQAVPYNGVYGVYLERLDVSSFRNATGEWDLTLSWSNAANTTTTIVTIDGSANATSTWVSQSATINAVLDSTAKILRLVTDEISGSASIISAGTLSYRLIG